VEAELHAEVRHARKARRPVGRQGGVAR
jgi:hypothetical protein